MNIEAVIFDCDGVLVDSEIIAARVGLKAARTLGLNYDEDTYIHRFTGMTLAAYLSGLNDDHHQAFGAPLPEGFTDRMLQEAEMEMNKNLTSIPGVHAAVAAITGPAVAVASSSGLERLRTKLKNAQLYDVFAPHYYSGDQVERGKPAPDLFLFAAEKLAVEASSCIAIEDSVNGVTSAVEAGMTVIGFTGGSHCRAGHDQYLKDAGSTVVIDHMDDLAGAITTLG